MRLPTHVAFSAVFWFGISSLFGWRPEGGAIGLAALGSILPEIDTPQSLLGSFTRPVSERVRARFGHRTLTHSFIGLAGLALVALPLGLWQFKWWLALLFGFFSHLALDMGTLSGTPLLWPNPRRCVFPGKDSMRLDTKEYGAARVELAIFSIFFIASVTLWPLASMGILGTVRYALGDIDQTYDEYRRMSADYQVFLQGRFQDNISKELLEGVYPIVDIYGQGYVILQDGELRTVGKSDQHNLHPLRVHLQQGDPIQDITVQVDLSGRYIGDLLPSIDLSREHYLYGSLELEEPIDPPYYSDRFNPISGSGTIKLNLGRWKDLVPYQDVKVRSGTVIIRQRLREGEEITSKVPSPKFADSTSSNLEPGTNVEPIPMTFKVATIDDLLIEAGDHVEVGDLIGRTTSEGLIRQRAAVELARARYEAGLIDEVELRAAERELSLLEVEHEVRAKIAGVITKIEIKSIKDQVEVVAYVRPDPDMADRLGLSSGRSGGVVGSPPSQSPSTTGSSCPPPLQQCDAAQVLNVVDGDTVDVLVGGRQERIRLIGVDTPETKHPDKPVECFGPEASAFTRETLDHYQVWLTYKPDERYDKYGRLLAYIWLNLDEDPEVENFNGWLVQEGYARVYSFFPFGYMDQFRGMEANAQATGMGLWDECGYRPYSR